MTSVPASLRQLNHLDRRGVHSPKVEIHVNHPIFHTGDSEPLTPLPSQEPAAAVFAAAIFLGDGGDPAAPRFIEQI